MIGITSLHTPSHPLINLLLATPTLPNPTQPKPHTQMFSHLSELPKDNHLHLHLLTLIPSHGRTIFYHPRPSLLLARPYQPLTLVCLHFQFCNSIWNSKFKIGNSQGIQNIVYINFGIFLG